MTSTNCVQILSIVIIIVNFSSSSTIVYPTIRVLQNAESRSTNNFTNYYNQTDNFQILNVAENSDLVIETNFIDSVGASRPKPKLIFECRAPYLVQWLYTGDGFPEFSTNLTMNSNPQEFIASIYLGFQKDLNEQDTGNYTCKSIRSQEMSSYVYLFSPGAVLFTTKGNDIAFRDTDESVRIPCSLSQPKASVNLQKSTNGQLHCPMNESISFDPKTGYTVRLRELSEPQGTYICTAGYNHKFQIIEYNLVFLNNSGKASTTTTTTTTTSSPTKNQRCQTNDECPSDKACYESTCVDPCNLICAKNTKCWVMNHTPKCVCNTGYIGDPYGTECVNKPQQSSTTEQLISTSTEPLYETTSTTTAAPKPKDPCEPNPCGQNTACRYDGRRLLCTCKSGYFGTPPQCLAECERDSDCIYNKACTREQKCEDPCRAGVCGRGARCRTVNHYPTCSCPSGTTGDPYIDCHNIGEFHTEKPQQIIRSPCDKAASPCGPNTQCITINNQAACHCISGYKGNPYRGCSVDGCNYNTHCPKELACLAENGTCVDPCILKAPCGEDRCLVKMHIPVCLSSSKESSSKENSKENLESLDACLSSPCGPNTICKSFKGAASCSCMSSFEGNPWVGCAKVRCHDNNSCAIGEECVGDICVKKSQPNEIVPEKISSSTNETGVNVCNPSPCGKRAVCRIINKMAICKCLVPFRGDPYLGCDAPCNRNSDCPSELSCSFKDGYCTNICSSRNPCGKNAICSISNHKVTCSCPDEGYVGNPVVECYPVSTHIQHDSAIADDEPAADIDPCTLQNCNTNERCVVTGITAMCECKENFTMHEKKGCVPKEKRSAESLESSESREMVLESLETSIESIEKVLQSLETPESKEKVSQSVETPESNVTLTSTTPKYVPCHPLPCGHNAFCNEKTDPRSCKCLPEYYGDPYSDCQRGVECETYSDCENEAACINKKCLDPCKVGGVCGENQICQTEYHVPTCHCKQGYEMDDTGDCQKDSKPDYVPLFYAKDNDHVQEHSTFFYRR